MLLLLDLACQIRILAVGGSFILLRGLLLLLVIWKGESVKLHGEHCNGEVEGFERSSLTVAFKVALQFPPLALPTCPRFKRLRRSVFF
jgi:hypothetical protein